jgi:hypothetical protein
MGMRDRLGTVFNTGGATNRGKGRDFSWGVTGTYWMPSSYTVNDLLSWEVLDKDEFRVLFRIGDRTFLRCHVLDEATRIKGESDAAEIPPNTDYDAVYLLSRRMDSIKEFDQLLFQPEHPDGTIYKGYHTAYVPTGNLSDDVCYNRNFSIPNPFEYNFPPSVGRSVTQRAGLHIQSGCNEKDFIASLIALSKTWPDINRYISDYMRSFGNEWIKIFKDTDKCPGVEDFGYIDGEFVIRGYVGNVDIGKQWHTIEELTGIVKQDVGWSILYRTVESYALHHGIERVPREGTAYRYASTNVLTAHQDLKSGVIVTCSRRPVNKDDPTCGVTCNGRLYNVFWKTDLKRI